MKALLKIAAVLVCALSAGCATPWYDVNDPIGYRTNYYSPNGIWDRPGYYGYYGYSGYYGSSRVYTQPCRPYTADGLMEWAKGAGTNVRHERAASVDTYNGVVDCRTSERAGSSSASPRPVRVWR